MDIFEVKFDETFVARFAFVPNSVKQIYWDSSARLRHSLYNAALK